MISYRVVYWIDIEADSPLDAAKSADWLMQEQNRHFKPAFSVIDMDADRQFKVDLEDDSCADRWWEGQGPTAQ